MTLMALMTLMTGLKIEDEKMRGKRERNSTKRKFILIQQFVSESNYWEPSALGYNTINTWSVRNFCLILEANTKENGRHQDIREGNLKSEEQIISNLHDIMRMSLGVEQGSLVE